MDKNKLGCWAEKIAIAYLMEKGFDVFDSCQTNGPVDIIAFDRQLHTVALFEVKSENRRLSGPQKGSRISRVARDKNLSHMINMLYVNREGKVMEVISRNGNDSRK